MVVEKTLVKGLSSGRERAYAYVAKDANTNKALIIPLAVNGDGSRPGGSVAKNETNILSSLGTSTILYHERS